MKNVISLKFYKGLHSIFFLWRIRADSYYENKNVYTIDSTNFLYFLFIF